MTARQSLVTYDSQLRVSHTWAAGGTQLVMAKRGEVGEYNGREHGWVGRMCSLEIWRRVLAEEPMKARCVGMRRDVHKAQVVWSI